MKTKDYINRIQYVLNRIVRSDMGKEYTAGWHFIKSVNAPNAIEFEFRVPIGFSFNNVERQVDALYATCGAPIELEDYGGLVVIRVIEKELSDKIVFDGKNIIEKGKLIIGYNQMMQLVYNEFFHPHMLIGAETGFGKTEFLRFILFQLCNNHTPDEIEIFIIDLKGGMSFLPFRSLPHVTHIAFDIETAYESMEDTYKEIMDRQQKVFEYGNRNAIKGFKRRVVIIDEAAELSPNIYTDKEEKRVARDIERFISSLTRLGRETRFNLFYSTQYPVEKVVNNQIKINCGARLCFHVQNEINSKVILDEVGGEKLKQKGRAIYRDYGKSQIIQVPYVPNDKGEDNNDSAWERILHPLKTELLSNGYSQRKHHERIIVDTACNNETNSNAKRLDIPAQESKQTDARAGSGEAGARRVVPKTKTLEIDTQGKILVECAQLPEDEDRSLDFDL